MFHIKEFILNIENKSTNYNIYYKDLIMNHLN